MINTPSHTYTVLCTEPHVHTSYTHTCPYHIITQLCTYTCVYMHKPMFIHDEGLSNESYYEKLEKNIKNTITNMTTIATTQSKIKSNVKSVS